MSIRDDFFANQAVAALWDVAVSIKRGNPLPLDSNSVFKNYTDLETYAAGVLAYPGQIVAVVNVDSTELYYLDQNLNIQPVGSVPTADDKSIEVVDGILSIHDYGSAYYKYVAEIKNEKGEITNPAHYEKVTVSEENPWIAGLEPRVVAEGDDLVIGWYEPNPTTIEGVQAQITALQKSVEDVVDEIGAPAENELTPATGIYGELDKKADKDKVYTKEETDALIAEVDHLKRKIFDSLDLAEEFIEENPLTADQYIYMIPSGLQLDSNRYYEYMLINGVLEQVGNWEVDLKDYFTEDELKTYLADYYTENEIEVILKDYTKTTTLSGYYTIAQVDNLLNGYYTTEEIATLLQKYVLAETDKSLVANSEIEKLATVTANAEPNFVKSVTSDFKVSETGQLSLESISIAQVANLQETLNNKIERTFTTNEDGSKTEWILLSPENQEKLAALTIGDGGDLEISGKVNADNVEGLSSWITANREIVSGLYPLKDSQKLSTIEEGAEKNFVKIVDTNQFLVDGNGNLTLLNVSAKKLNDLSEDFVFVEEQGLSLAHDYVTTSLYRSEVGDLSKLIKATKGEGSTNLVDEVNFINERLAWQEMSESEI